MREEWVIDVPPSNTGESDSAGQVYEMLLAKPHKRGKLSEGRR